MLYHAPGALARTTPPACPAAEYPPAASPAPRGPARRTPRGHAVGPRRSPAGRPGSGKGASLGPGYRSSGCWGHGGRAGRAGSRGEAGTGRQRGDQGPRSSGDAHSPWREGRGSPEGRHMRDSRSRTHRLHGAHGPRRSPRCRRRRPARRYHRDPGRRRHVTTPPGSRRAGRLQLPCAVQRPLAAGGGEGCSLGAGTRRGAAPERERHGT